MNSFCIDHYQGDACKMCPAKTGQCRSRNVNYSVYCLKCKHTYWGETHRTLFDRVQEHLDDIANSEEKNAMVKYMAIYHPNESPDFSFKLHKSSKTSLACQIGDALEITGHNCSSLMNCRSEWGMNGVPRVSVNTLEGPQPSAPQPVQYNPKCAKKQPV